MYACLASRPNNLKYMKIIYFTTAQEKEDYISFSSSWKSTLNTSIQNLHNRLIRSLAMTHEVDVISIRPFSRKYCKLNMLNASVKQEGRITWHYVKINRLKLSRLLAVRSQCKKIVSKLNLKDAIVITDTLNPTVLFNATRIAKKYHLPIIGVCNNTPSGIHGTGRSYTKFLLSTASDLSGYISLTPGLNELFNKNNRANISFEGILESKSRSFNTAKYGKYLFFDGSLEEKYGIYDLIKAFKSLDNKEFKLLISGYHINTVKFSRVLEGSKNIVYLGNLQNDEVISLANNSVLNINPRPYSEDFDRYLIPDNMVDYLGANSLLLSVKNRNFKKEFENDAIWINSNSMVDFVNGLETALNLSKEERSLMIKKANLDANKLYSMEAINRRLILFLKQFLKQKE